MAEIIINLEKTNYFDIVATSVHNCLLFDPGTN